MDLLLQEFIDRHLDTLSDEEKRAFEDMLNESDLDIMAWIMNKRQPHREDYLPIIHLLQQTNNKSEHEFQS